MPGQPKAKTSSADGHPNSIDFGCVKFWKFRFF